VEGLGGGKGAVLHCADAHCFLKRLSSLGRTLRFNFCSSFPCERSKTTEQSARDYIMGAEGIIPYWFHEGIRLTFRGQKTMDINESA